MTRDTQVGNRGDGIRVLLPCSPWLADYPTRVNRWCVIVDPRYERLLEKEDKERADRLAATYARSQGRAAAAGKKVVEERELKAKEDEERMQRMWAEREAQLQAQEEREREAKAAATASQLKTLEQQMAWRAETKRAEKQAEDDWISSVKAQDRAAQEAELEAARKRRADNIAHREALQRQMEELELHRNDEEFMSFHERKINKPLLMQACEVMGVDPMVV